MSRAPTLPPEPLAPWAEIVPNVPPMTVEELAALPDDRWQ